MKDARNGRNRVSLEMACSIEFAKKIKEVCILEDMTVSSLLAQGAANVLYEMGYTEESRIMHDVRGLNYTYPARRMPTRQLREIQEERESDIERAY